MGVKKRKRSVLSLAAANVSRVRSMVAQGKAPHADLDHAIGELDMARRLSEPQPGGPPRAAAPPRPPATPKKPAKKAAAKPKAKPKAKAPAAPATPASSGAECVVTDDAGAVVARSGAMPRGKAKKWFASWAKRNPGKGKRAVFVEGGKQYDARVRARTLWHKGK